MIFILFGTESSYDYRLSCRSCRSQRLRYLVDIHVIDPVGKIYDAVLGHTEETNHDIAEAEAAFFAKYAIAPPPLIHKIQSKTAVAISEQFDISLEAAMYARDYYLKWLQFGPHEYLEYEVVLLNQVQLSVS